MNDLRFAVSQLLKNPGYTAVTVLSLGLGIAFNPTISSFANALLTRPAPGQAPGELWHVWRHNLKGGSVRERYYGLSYPRYVYFREHNQSFISLASFDPETPFVSWNRDGIDQSIESQLVSGDSFDVCRVRMILARAFCPEEDRRPGAIPVVVVSHTFWKHQLASDTQIVGQKLMVNGSNLTGVGVAPDGFTRLLAGLSSDVGTIPDGPVGSA